MKTECPNCKSRFTAPNNFIGKQVKCPKCKESFLIKNIEDEVQGHKVKKENNLRTKSSLKIKESENPKTNDSNKISLETSHKELNENEIVNCGNCGTRIGKLEKKYKWSEYVVCETCFHKFKPDAPILKKSSVAGIIKKPGKFSAIAGMRMAAGVCDILAGLVFSWLFFPLVMIPFGVIEIISASNLLKEKPAYPHSIKTIAILEIVSIVTMAGWISIISGIISLVFLADEKVKGYLSYLQKSKNLK